MPLDTARTTADSIADHLSDHNALHAFYNGFADFPTQYVHPDGSDSNSGNNPGVPKATIEAAYGDLPAQGGSIILASQQEHDVGDGLSLTRTKPVDMRGGGRARRARGTSSLVNDAPRIYTSTGASTLIDFPLPVSSTNGFGFSFEGLDFIPSTTTTKVFVGQAMNHVWVVNCGAYHDYDDSTQNAFQFIDVPAPGSLGDDASWWRVTDNYVRGGTLVTTTGPNNRWKIDGNIVFAVNATDPIVHLAGAHGSLLRGNNMEGASVECAIKLSGTSYSCQVWGDAGEAISPFVIVDASYGNLLMPSGISTPGTSKLVQFTNGASDNVVVAAVSTGFADIPYDHAEWIDDDTTNKRNWIFGSSGNSTAANIHKQRTLGLLDGATAPSTQTGVARIYVDSADGDLKVKFGDGTVTVIAADT